MDILKPYINLLGSRPVRTAEFLLAASARSIWGRLIGPSLTPAEIARRARETPVQKAVLGALTLRDGVAAEDPDLRDYGQAMVAQAMDEALRRPNDLVVEAAVTEVAAATPLDGIADNPYVPPQVANRVASVVAELQQPPPEAP